MKENTLFFLIVFATFSSLTYLKRWQNNKHNNLTTFFVHSISFWGVWIWDSSCSNKVKVFSWLLTMDRLNVWNILRRKKCNWKATITTVQYVLWAEGRQPSTSSSPTPSVYSVGSIWASHETLAFPSTHC
jgi:hypothetical protein